MSYHVSCFNDINRWMTSNHRKLKTDTTQFIILDSKQQHTNVNGSSIHLGNAILPVLSTVTCPGVIQDSEMTRVQHVREITSRSFYQLRQIHAVRKSLNVETAKLLIHSLLTADWTTAIAF